MKIAILTAEEAADPAVMRNLAEHFLSNAAHTVVAPLTQAEAKEQKALIKSFITPAETAYHKGVEQNIEGGKISPGVQLHSGGLVSQPEARKTLATLLAPGEYVLPFAEQGSAEIAYRKGVEQHIEAGKAPSNPHLDKFVEDARDIAAILGSGATASALNPLDHPSAGAPEAPLPQPAVISTIDTASLFGGAAAQLPPQASAASAPSTAAAAPLPTAATTLPLPPPAASLPALPAVPSAPAPAAPALPASPAATGTGFDATGMPWDGRIHASSKTTTADGSWRKKRGVEPILLAQIEAQIRAVLATPVPAGTPAPVPQPPAMLPAAPPTTAAPTADFSSFAAWLSQMMVAGKVTTDHVASVAADCGLPGGLVSLMHRPDLIPVVRQRFEEIAAS